MRGGAIKVNSFSGQFRAFFDLIWFFNVGPYVSNVCLELLVLLPLLPSAEIIRVISQHAQLLFFIF